MTYGRFWEEGVTLQSQSTVPSVSILIPVLNEINHLEALLNSIEEQSYPKDRVEVLLLDGGSTDGSLSWLESHARLYTFPLRVVDNPRRYQSPGLNLGLRDAKGELIIRMDAHAVYDKDYVSAAISVLISRPEVLNVGGTQVAEGTGAFSRAAAIAMNSPIGVGGATFRYAKTPQEADSVFLGAWRRADLAQVGGWNDEWVINEDGELNLRLRRTFRDRILLVTPAMKVRYHPRSRLATLAKQYYKYGFWRQKTLNSYPEALRISHLAPIVLVLGLFITVILGFLPGLRFSWLLPIIYAGAVFAAGLTLTVKAAMPVLGPLTALALGAMHLSWGVGALAGMVHYGVPVDAIRRLGQRSVISDRA